MYHYDLPNTNRETDTRLPAGRQIYPKAMRELVVSIVSYMQNTRVTDYS